jgi:hypothetical protein
MRGWFPKCASDSRLQTTRHARKCFTRNCKHPNICKHIPCQFNLEVNSKRNEPFAYARGTWLWLIKLELLFQIALFHNIWLPVSLQKQRDHQDTLSLMEYVKYNFGYMYSYSERPEHWKKNGRWRAWRNQSKIARNCRFNKNMLGFVVRNSLDKR